MDENLKNLHIRNEDSLTKLTKLNECVEELHKLRDYYFETHPIEDAFRKTADVQIKLNETLRIFNEFTDCATQNRAKYNYLKGRALNVTPDYNKEAEELLSKAIKLDPKLINAWNELGECYWKNDNMQEAKNCFHGALNQKRNKVSLRNLSMVARQEKAKTQEELEKNIELGLVYAKEAVQMDTQDGLSWTVLGNAHLSSFFCISQNPKTLKQCLSAYTQAEKDLVAKNSSHLHYNKAITLKYEEEFQLALESFSQAIRLDPGWDVPNMKQQQLIKYLDNVNELVGTTGKMNGKKRLQQILNSIDSKQLGPYFGGNYTSPKGQSVKLKEVHLSDLDPGINVEKVVLGKVVCSVHNDDSVPFTFCLVDKKGTCVSITVYNLAAGKGVIIGDSVAIPEPFVTDVRFWHETKEYKFRSIRIDTPLVMVVNSKKVNRDQQANVQMSIFKQVE